MSIEKLMDQLVSTKLEVPDEIKILELRRSSVDEQERRLKKLLKGSAEACECNFDRGEWQTLDDHTLVRLPKGARAVLHHASGAIKVSSGLAPMEALFKEVEPEKQLVERTTQLLARIGLQDMLGRSETLEFERLWRTMAQACHRDGHVSEPVLCRAVGAYRHHIEGIPVLGPASVALQVCGNGTLDLASMLLRQPGGDVVEKAKTIHPERGARQLLQNLSIQFDHIKTERNETVHFDCPDGMKFGYFSFPKRKPQRLLAPVYVALIDIQHEKVRQGMVLIASATEKPYLSLNLPGNESPTMKNSKTCVLLIKP